MKQIAFSHTEILEIKEYYSKELQKLENRANEIHTILQRIKDLKKSEAKAETVKAVKVKPAKTETVKVKPAKTETVKVEPLKVETPEVKTEPVKVEIVKLAVGRPKDLNSKVAKYEDFVVNLITNTNKFVSSKAIFDAVEKEFNISAKEYSKMKATVTVIISKTKASNRIKDFQPKKSGSRMKCYGLASWFKNEKPIRKFLK